MSFNQFNLSPEFISHLESIGFVQPTEIQIKAIPHLLENETDFIGLAATGTGKTAAFGLPLIEKLDLNQKHPQALILSPTRELAMQIVEQLKKLGSFKKLKVAAIYGGSSYRKQIEDLKRGAQIVVATPGRLIDLLEQNTLKITDLKCLILDEADEMISMGFRDSLEAILERTHAKDEDADEGKTSKSKGRRASCKTWLFSATMSMAIKKLTTNYLETPFVVEIQNKGPLSSQIKQLYFTVKEDLKLKALTNLLDVLPEFYGIIFCETKLKCAEVEEQLTKKGYFVDSLHGDKQQKEREWTLKKFKNKDVKVIVATDVAARGLDVADLTHVVNYSLPWDTESYVHRIGRTGRNGKTGYSYSLVSPRELSTLKQIINKTKASIEKGSVPTANEVLKLKIKMALDKLNSLSNGLPEELVSSLSEIEEFNSLVELSKEQIIVKYLTQALEKNLKDSHIDFDYLNGRAPRELSADSSAPRSNDRERDYSPRGRGGYGGNRRSGGRDSGPRDYSRSNSRGSSFGRSYNNSEKPRFNDKFADEKVAGKSSFRPARFSEDDSSISGQERSSRPRSSGVRTTRDRDFKSPKENHSSTSYSGEKKSRGPKFLDKPERSFRFNFKDDAE